MLDFSNRVRVSEFILSWANMQTSLEVTSRLCNEEQEKVYCQYSIDGILNIPFTYS